MKEILKNLTALEQKLFNAVIRGMDAHGCGWYHEILSRAGLEEDHSSAGVLGSLVKKELVESTNEWDPDMLNIDSSGLYWVKLTTKAADALGMVEDDMWEVFEWDYKSNGKLPQV